jgi:hypothetical protein
MDSFGRTRGRPVRMADGRKHIETKSVYGRDDLATSGVRLEVSRFDLGDSIGGQSDGSWAKAISACAMKLL